MLARKHQRPAGDEALQFGEATTEPVKVIAPIAMPSDISTRLLPWIEPRTPMP